MSPAPVVIKVGGSLFDLPDLGVRLERWLRLEPGAPVLLVPGGGPIADAIRNLDRRHRLGEEKAHWLALRALTVNAWFLTDLLPPGTLEVVQRVEDGPFLWNRGIVPIVDPHAFALADEGRPGCLPHTWSVTSDSLSARIAAVCQASQLILLKSVSMPPNLTWEAASASGLVDAHWPLVAGLVPRIRIVNFRHWQP
jgi:aspartokinase-like uncharacterized kinase